MADLSFWADLVGALPPAARAAALAERAQAGRLEHRHRRGVQVPDGGGPRGIPPVLGHREQAPRQGVHQRRPAQPPGLAAADVDLSSRVVATTWAYVLLDSACTHEQRRQRTGDLYIGPPGYA